MNDDKRQAVIYLLSSAFSLNTLLYVDREHSDMPIPSKEYQEVNDSLVAAAIEAGLTLDEARDVIQETKEVMINAHEEIAKNQSEC